MARVVVGGEREGKCGVGEVRWCVEGDEAEGDRVDGGWWEA
mgnify:CR=1 FL=1